MTVFEKKILSRNAILHILSDWLNQAFRKEVFFSIIWTIVNIYSYKFIDNLACVKTIYPSSLYMDHYYSYWDILQRGLVVGNANSLITVISSLPLHKSFHLDVARHDLRCEYLRSHGNLFVCLGFVKWMLHLPDGWSITTHRFDSVDRNFDFSSCLLTVIRDDYDCQLLAKLIWKNIPIHLLLTYLQRRLAEERWYTDQYIKWEVLFIHYLFPLKKIW